MESHIKERNQQAQLNRLYDKAVEMMRSAKIKADFDKAAHAFEQIPGFRDADSQAVQCREQGEIVRKDSILADAKEKMEFKQLPASESALELLKSISGWKDADELYAACQKQIADLQAKSEKQRADKEKAIRKRNKIIAITTPIICGCIVLLIVLTKLIIPSGRYNDAVALMEAGQYEEAIPAFEALGGYKDSKTILLALRRATTSANILSAAGSYTVGVKADGTVVATGDNEDGQCNVGNWTDIVAVADGSGYIVGLNADGTVLATGDNEDGQCNVGNWTDIVAVDARDYCTVGLKSDGTVVATGDNWYGQCDVNNWTDIVAVAAGGFYTVGLKSDGTVVATGDNKYGQCDVDKWTDIVAVDAGGYYTVGLKSDGTVVATGDNEYGQCDVFGWQLY